MAKKKYHYYVAVVLRDGTIRLITAVDHKNKTWRYSETEAPLEMEQFWARDLVLGMLLNFTMGFVVESQIEITEQYGLKGEN